MKHHSLTKSNSNKNKISAIHGLASCIERFSILALKNQQLYKNVPITYIRNYEYVKFFRNNKLKKLEIMKATLTFFTLLLFSVFNGFAQEIKITPVHHASLIIEYGQLTIFIDPASDIEKFNSFAEPDIILITHTHGDHLNPELINTLKSDKTSVIGSKAAIDQIGYGIYLMNGEKKIVKGVNIEAIPAYNTSEERLRYHPVGVGNGYVLNLGVERLYISGDTEDTKEMRALKNIDYAFVCMNLPFTMTPEQAASAVLEFKPKKVFPYHYSQDKGYSDIKLFNKLVTEGSSTEVVLLDWYNQKN